VKGALAVGGSSSEDPDSRVVRRRRGRSRTPAGGSQPMYLGKIKLRTKVWTQKTGRANPRMPKIRKA
jgi:hypothetical protein